MDMRDMRRLPPRNSRGEFRRRRGGRRRDRGMTGYDRGMPYEREMDYNMQGGRDYDYGYGDMRRSNYPDMRRSDYGETATMDRRGMDGHYMHGGQSMGGQTYYPIEAMGRFNGYWGMPEQDYGRSGRGIDRGYDYDMRRRDYAYNDYGNYDDYGDYGDTLSKEELSKWCEKLKKELNEQEKQMFHKNIVSQKARQFGIEMKGFGEEELEVVALMLYDDYKKSLGQNPDIYIKLAGDWLNDKDAAAKGAEKLAIYHDEIVMGGDE